MNQRVKDPKFPPAAGPGDPACAGSRLAPTESAPPGRIFRASRNIRVKSILNIVVVIAVILWLLYGFGVLSGSGDIRMPTVR
jgi:hypothetical protein